MITARELVFYIRAEDQASRVVKRAAKSFGSLGNIKNLQNNAGKIQEKNARSLASAEQALARNLTAVDRAQVAVNRSGRTLTRATKRYGASSPITQDFATANAANIRALETAQRQTQLLEGDLKKVAAAGDEAAAANARLVSEAQIARVNNYISSIQGAARAIRIFGVVAGASLAFAAHSAANFQTQLTLAASQARPVGAGAGATANIAGRLQNVVLQQMQKFPATSQQMANALYEIFSSTNIQGIKQAGSLLTTLNQAAVAGGVDLGTMSNAAITLFNNFVVGGKKGGDEFNNLTQALNVFFSAVRFGRMNATQFANSLSYVSGIAKEAGLNFTDVADAMAILTRQTGSARTNQDAQGLARLIQQLSTAADIQGLQQIGVQAIDPLTKKLKPLLPLLDEIKKKADLRGVNALNFFKVIGNNKGTIQAQRAFAYLTGNMAQYIKVSKEVNSDTNEFQKSFEALSKSPGVRWQVFINQIKALVILIGADAIPAFVSLGKYIQKIITWFNSLSDSTKRQIAIIGVYGSVIAVLGGTFVIIAGSIGKFILTMKELRLASLASEAGFATTKFSLLAAAIVAAGIVLAKYPKQVHAVINALGGLSVIIQEIGKAIALLALLRLVKQMSQTGEAAALAGGKVGLLQKSLLGLRLLGPYIATIILLYKPVKNLDKQLTKHPLTTKNIYGQNEDVKKTFESQLPPVVAQVAEAGAVAGNKFGMWFNKQVAHWLDIGAVKEHKKLADLATPGTAANTAAENGFKRSAELQTIINSKTSDYNKMLAQSYFAEGKWSAFIGILNQVNQAADAGRQQIVGLVNMMDAAIQRGLALAASAKKANKPGIQNALLQKVIALDKIASKPNATIAQIKAYMDAMDQLQKAEGTGNQFAATQQYISNLEQSWNKAAEAAASATKKAAAARKKALAAMDKGTKAELNTRLKAVAKLDMAYRKNPTLANHTKYYAALTKLNKDYASKASQDYIHNYIDKVISADKAAAAAHKKILADNIKNAKSMIKDLSDGIQGMYDTLLQQNQSNFGDLFAGPFLSGPRQQNLSDWGFKPRGVDLLKDIKSQVFQFKRFNRDVANLGKRGAPKAFQDQLEALGPQGAKDQVKALAKLTPQQFREYIKAWNEGQKAIKANTMKQLNNQLSIYEKFGKKVASAIIRGIQSDNPKLTKVFQNLINEMFPGLARQAAGHGTGTGKPKGTSKPKATGAHTTAYHYHVHTDDPKKAMTELKHMNFRMRNGVLV